MAATAETKAPEQLHLRSGQLLAGRAAASKLRVLFLCHSASRNGATILLLNLLRWLRDRTDHHFEVLVAGQGQLLSEFQELAPTHVLRNVSRLLTLTPRPWRQAFQPRLERALLNTALAGRRYDVVHVNTVAQWQQVPSLAARSRRLLWHIHELGFAIRLLMDENWRTTFPLAHRFLAVSQSVREALAGEFKVPAGKVDLVHGFIPVPQLTREEIQAKQWRIRRELGWPEEALVVGACGSLGWRKGSDLFLQAAEEVCRQVGERARFLWVASGTNRQEELQFLHDIRARGLERCCRLAAETSNVLDYYCAMDVFALSSREDPFPLVMLEAGALGLPVVCFANSGGGPEFVNDDAGLVAPCLNVSFFASHLASLLNRPELRQQMGEAAARRVRSCHTLEEQGPKYLRTLEECGRQ